MYPISIAFTIILFLLQQQCIR